MINRTLQYFKNIKFNSFINKTLANQGKKKMMIINIKNKQKNIHQYSQIRKMSSRTFSFNSRPFNENPKPPFDGRWIAIAAFMCGTYFTFKKNVN